VLRLDPTPVSETVKLVSKVEVVNLYQTSSSGFPEAQPVGIPLLAVANQTVPAVALPDVNETALLQSSFEGGLGSVTQILKVAFEDGAGLLVESTRT
jgi:hypothetical protein